MKALILAAGLGTRLLPYTKTRPKPLFTLGGTPVLKLIIDKLIQAGCTDIIINTHHLHRQIEQFIKQAYFPVHIETRHEPELLETGGAIKNVRDFMGNSPFFVINSDIVSNIDLKKVWDFHLKGNWPVTLVMHNYPKFNKVEVNKKNFVTGFKGKTTGIQRTEMCCQEEKTGFQKIENSFQEEAKGATRTQEKNFKKKEIFSGCGQLLAFTGIQVLSPEIFRHMPLKKKFSSIALYTELATKGDKKVKAYICSNQYWNDIGTIEAYKKACMLHIYMKVLYKNSVNAAINKNMLNTHIPIFCYKAGAEKNLKAIEIIELKGDGSCREWFRIEISDKLLLKMPGSSSLKKLSHKGLRSEPKIEIEAEAGTEAKSEQRSGAKSKLENNQHTKFNSLIFGYHGICSEKFKNNGNDNSEDGNNDYDNGYNYNNKCDCDYECNYGYADTYNLIHGDINSHFDHKTGKTREIESFVAIGKHLFSIGIPVPKIYDYDFFSGMVALEDLGDTHLQQIINKSQSKDEIVNWYERICDHLINFSIKGMKNFEPCWTFQTDAYTKQLILEKECQYFLHAFICGYLKKKIKFLEIKKACEFIADNALRYSFTGLMHRDMQSRNIMIKNGQIFFIDFQGARKGPLQYDLASLLIDPYVDLHPEIRGKILEYCARKINKFTEFDKDKFIQGFKFCTITRNMQILGAFSFLSMVKGKKSFENYIPCALNTLRINIDLLNNEANGKLESIKNLLDKT